MAKLPSAAVLQISKAHSHLVATIAEGRRVRLDVSAELARLTFPSVLEAGGLIGVAAASLQVLAGWDLGGVLEQTALQTQDSKVHKAAGLLSAACRARACGNAAPPHPSGPRNCPPTQSRGLHADAPGCDGGAGCLRPRHGCSWRRLRGAYNCEAA